MVSVLAAKTSAKQLYYTGERPLKAGLTGGRKSTQKSQYSHIDIVSPQISLLLSKPIIPSCPGVVIQIGKFYPPQISECLLNLAYQFLKQVFDVRVCPLLSPGLSQACI